MEPDFDKDKMMIFSSHYFGSIPYFQSLVKEKKVIIDIFEKYNKQTWRNRMQILSGNGIQHLSIPVKRPLGNESLVYEILIDNKEDWQNDHWKAIVSSYQHAPYFYYYGDTIQQLIFQDEPLLYRFNTKILEQIIQWLELEIEFVFSEQKIPVQNPADYRITLNKKHLDYKQRQYIQVFSDKFPFFSNLSILDLLFNEGPITRNFLTIPIP